jgi:RNA polymerase sigma-70 factor (ECF subfamily)
MNPSNMSEADAICLAQKGDANGFERIYESHSRRVYGLCLRTLGNTTEAEDLTREVFLQLFRGIHTYRGEENLSSCLHRLAVNILFTRLRGKQNRTVSLDAMAETPPEKLPVG